MSTEKRAILLYPDGSLLEKTAGLILEHPDLSDLVVITPSRRTLLFLSKELSKHIKKPLLSPLMFSIEDYINFLYEKHVSPPLPLLSPLDAVYFIEDANRETGLFKTYSLDTLLPWAFKFYSDFEELYIEGVSYEKLSEIDELVKEENLPTSIKNKISRFSEIYRLFYEKIRDRFSTRATRYRKVANLDVDFFTKPHILLGFYALTGAEKEIFKKILMNSESLFISYYDKKIIDYLTKWDISPELPANLSENSPEIHIYKTSSVHGEVLGVKEILEEKGKDSIDNVVVLPDEAHLFAVVNNLNYTERNISAGYPLIRTPFFSLIAFIEELILGRINGRYLKTNYLDVILHPYVKNTRFKKETIVTRVLMHTIEEVLKNLGITYITLEEVENPQIVREALKKLKNDKTEINEEELLEHLKYIHNTVIRPFENIETIGDFIDKVLNLADFVSQKTTATLHPFGSPFLEATLNTLIEIKNSLIAERSLKDARYYFYLLKTYVKTRRVPFKGTPLKGLQILGTLETRNLKFKRVFYIDMNEGIIPDVKKEDTVLSDSLRRYLGLPTAKDRESIIRYYFFNLINGAEEVHLFYTTRNLEPSRYIEMIKWQSEKKEGEIDTIKEKEITFNIALSHRDLEEVKKTEETINILKNFTFSPTSLDAYLKCPLMFYYQYILLPRKEREQTPAKSRLEVGNIVHEILKEYFYDFKGKEYRISDMETEYKRIDSLIEKHFKDETSNELFIQKEQVRYALHSLLERHMKEFNGVKILELEFPMPHKLEIDEYTKVNIVGKFDRIHMQDDVVFIIDYKTGSEAGRRGVPQVREFPDENNRDKWHTIIRSFQLPLYTMLYHWRKKIPYEKIKAQIWSIREINTEHFINEFSMDTHKKQQSYEFALKTIIKEILNPEIPFSPVPQEKAKNICNSCPYKALCDRGWVKKKW